MQRFKIAFHSKRNPDAPTLPPPTQLPHAYTHTINHVNLQNVRSSENGENGERQPSFTVIFALLLKGTKIIRVVAISGASKTSTHFYCYERLFCENDREILRIIYYQNIEFTNYSRSVNVYSFVERQFTLTSS